MEPEGRLCVGDGECSLGREGIGFEIVVRVEELCFWLAWLAGEWVNGLSNRHTLSRFLGGAAAPLIGTSYQEGLDY